MRSARGLSHPLEIAHFSVAISAFALGAVMAVMQALSRADIDVVFRSPQMYYLSMTAHGVLMALVFTTFFIMGLIWAVFTMFIAIGVVTLGGGGFLLMIGLFDKDSDVAYMSLIVLILFAGLSITMFYQLVSIHRRYRNGGHTLEQAKKELVVDAATTGV